MKEAFDKAAKEYDQYRRKLIPCFDEFYGTAVDVVPFPAKAEINVLDLGAGTGLLSERVAKRFPNANLTLMDLSEPMLEEAKKRLSKLDIPQKYIIGDYSQREQIKDQYDLILSALSIHHLEEADKERLFQNLYLHLNPKGLFINADQVLGENEEIDQSYKTNWVKRVTENGITAKELLVAQERMKEDKLSTLSTQLTFLKNCGFSQVNCWYKNYSFVVYSGLKK